MAKAGLMMDLTVMLDSLPENRNLYKDSGLWQIRSDDDNDVLFQQTLNESFYDFIERCWEKENTYYWDPTELI